MDGRLTTREDMDDLKRKNGRQRRDPTNTIGFNRYGLQESTYYEPPKEYDDDAKRYLIGLARCGTLSGGAKLAGIGVHRVYEFRRKIEGFRDEEEVAFDVMMDAIEESLFQIGLGFDSSVTGSARVTAITKALEANRGYKYNVEKKNRVEANVEMTWLDLIKQVSSEEN